jgi:hypothetical protein
MAKVVLYQKCPQCHGTQLFQPSSGEGSEPIPCNWPGCEQGYVEFGGFIINPSLDVLNTKLDTVLAKLDEILTELE